MKPSSLLWPAFLLWFVAAAGSHIVLFVIRMPFVFHLVDPARIDLLLIATRAVNVGETACSVLLAIALFTAARDAERRIAVRVMSAIVLLMFAAMSSFEIVIPLLGGAGLSGPAWAVYLACRLLLGLSAAAAGIAVFAAPRIAWVFALAPPIIHLATYTAYEIAWSQSYSSSGGVDRIFGLVTVASVLLLLCAVAAGLKRSAVPAP